MKTAIIENGKLIALFGNTDYKAVHQAMHDMGFTKFFIRYAFGQIVAEAAL